jgi:nucleotide-binding universal stress UspA family protein
LLADSVGGKLAIVHAPPDLASLVGAYALDTGLRQQYEQRIGDDLAALTERTGCVGECYVTPGDPAAQIASLAVRLRAGLVVIGATNAIGRAGEALSNAYAIVHRTPCPVVSVHSPAARRAIAA